MKFAHLLLFALLGLAALPSVLGHGRLVKPVPRGKYAGKYDYQENAPVANPPGAAGSEFICRNDPAPSSDKWVQVRSGQPVTMQWEMTAAHVGDCAVYITYDTNKAEGSMKWFKIANLPSCKDQNTQDVNVMIPSYLPSCDHCILRWEWYALHNRPNVEWYNQCVDIKIAGNPNGGLPSPMVSIPGNLPMDGTQYRDPYNGGPQYITGPAVATYDGNANPPASTSTSSSGSTSTSTSSSGSATSSSSSSSGSATSPSSSGSATSSSSSGTATSSSSSSSGSTNTNQCVLGTTVCKATPESAADYQCCAPGASCFLSNTFGVCCGPYTAGCIYGSATKKTSTCCDTRYYKCDATAGCVQV